MIIGIDGNEANVEQKVGVSWYVYYLLKEFQKSNLSDASTQTVSDVGARSLKVSDKLQNNNIYFRVFLKDLPREDLPEETKYFKYVVIPKKTVWSQIDLPLALFSKYRDLSVFFAPAHYAPRFCPAKTVVTIHDLSFFYYPQDFLKKDLYQLQHWTEYSVKKASKVIAVSENTKLDLEKNYGLVSDKINVIYNGFFNPEQVLSGNRFSQSSDLHPYFLYIGTLQPRKNLENTLLAFVRVLKKHPNYRLFLVGKKGWMYEDLFALVKNWKLMDKVIFTGYVSEDEKQKLLTSAQAVIMPEFYGGFGLPILEGFAFSCPVLCAKTGSLPEVGGDACLYFDPTKISEIELAMNQIIDNQALANELIQKGKVLLKKYSWEVTAQKTLNLLTGL